MPRVNWLKNRENQLRVIIFGDTVQKTNIYGLAAAIKVNPKTVYSWREKPMRIKIENLAAIGKALRWSEEEWNEVIGILKGK